MPTTLSKTEQLSAASNQLQTWYKQQLATGNPLLGTQYSQKAYDILNSGNYPALELAVPNGQPPDSFDITFALPEDLGPYTVVSNNTGFGTGQQSSIPRTNITAQQYADALNASPNTNQGTAFDSALAQSYGAQVANEQATTSVTAATAAAASQQQAIEQANVIAQQQAIVAGNTTNTATSSGNGTPLPLTQQQIVDNANAVQAAQTATVNQTNRVPLVPNQTINAATNGVTEDSTSAATPSVTNTIKFSDQTNSNIGTGSKIKPGEDVMSSTAATLSSGIASGGSDSASSAGNNGTTNIINAPDNKLHSYVNWTYKISIYGVPYTTINQMYDGTIAPGNEEAILAGSYFVLSDGGYGGNTASRNFFPNDLTIDNVEIETIVSNDQKTRGTDVIRIKFDIIEPYTVKFLGQLQQLALQLNPGASWDASFYVMKIEFLGYDDLGQPKSIDNTTKYIPFTFLNMKFKITSSGAIYSCDVIPTNSMASTVLDNQIPFHVEIQGATITELFQSESASYNTTTNKLRPNSADQEIRTTITENGPIGTNTTVIKGLADALNKNEADKCLKDNSGQLLPNNYKFVFDDKINNAKIFDPNKFSTQSTGSTDPKNLQNALDGKSGALPLELKNGKFNAQAGTKITDFISSVITVSSYMLDQYKPGDKSNTPLSLWKTNPVVKYREWDTSRNFWAMDIAYYVTPYDLKGQDSQNFGQAAVSPSEIVKSYDYLYSGNNKDVLSVDIDFQMAFYEIINGLSSHAQLTKDTPGSQQITASSGQSAQYDSSQDQRFFKRRKHYVNGIANRQNSAPTGLDEATIAIQNVMERNFDTSGDMIRLNIEIVGDPDWLAQDTMLYGPLIGGFDPILSSGSVNFLKPAYFNFFFQTPTNDYNDTTGLFQIDGAYSQFSGTYQVVRVISNFSGGKFTQKLDNVRVPTQEPPTAGASRSETVGNQTVNSATRGVSENPPAEAAKNKTIAVNPPPPPVGGSTAPFGSPSEEDSGIVGTGYAFGA